MFQEEYAVAYFPKQQKTHLISSVVSSNAAYWEKKSNILYVAIPIFLSFTAQFFCKATFRPKKLLFKAFIA